MGLLAESKKKTITDICALKYNLTSTDTEHVSFLKPQLYCLNSHCKERQAPANYNIKTDTHLNAQKIGRVTPSFWVAVKTRRRGSTIETSGFPPFSKRIFKNFDVHAKFLTLCASNFREWYSQTLSPPTKLPPTGVDSPPTNKSGIPDVGSLI